MKYIQLNLKMRAGYGLFIMFVLIILMPVFADAQVGAEPRTKQRLCDAWQFHLGDQKGAEHQDFDDTTWRTLDVPHDWAIEGPIDPKNYNRAGYKPNEGVGWYRKTFTVPENAEDKMVFVDFDGVYMNSKVWINGHLLGFRPFGFISFRYDLTPYLNKDGKENVMAVRTELKRANLRWYPGAGINRRVWLTTVNPIHIAHWGSYVTTPEVSNKKSLVRLRTEVKNQSGNSSVVTIKSVMVDMLGREVAEASATQSIAAGVMHEFDQKFTVTNPQLWSPDTPDLYHVASTLETNGNTVDKVTTNLGIRKFKFTLDRGLIFNDEEMDVKGVCLHADFGPLGTAFNPRALERRLEIMREMGCNAIRTSHNPRDPEFYDMCDRMGFFVMNEAFDEWKIPKLPQNTGYASFFDEWSERDLTDFIRRDRNHPSVIMWSIGNEINEQYVAGGGKMSARLATICKKHDPSRPVTAGCNSPAYATKNGFDKALDVFGLNYSYDAYDEYKGKMIMIGSENSTHWSTRGCYPLYRPLRGDIEILPVNNNVECSAYGNYRERNAEVSLKKLRASSWVAGQFAWTGFDYRGEAHPYQWPAISGVWGIVDMVGFPKDQYYLYQSDWSDKPMVHIVPQTWNWMQYPDKKIPVWVYSNCDEVELFLNNKSLGFRKIDREKILHFEWGVKYVPGTLKAVGWKNGKKVCSQVLQTTGKPSGLVMVADRTKIAADGSDLSYVEVRVVDEKGRISPEANQQLINFEVLGDGEIIGVSNGSSYSHDPSKGNSVHAFRGLCMVVLKSTRKAGSIQLKGSTDGLSSARVTIETLPAGSTELAKLAVEREYRVRENNKQFSRHRIAVLAMKNGIPAGQQLNLQAQVDTQEELAAYAAAAFPEISLKPTVHLCESLTDQSVKSQIMEHGGMRELRAAYEMKDWLGVLAVLGADVKNGYPDRRELDRLLRVLKEKSFRLNLQPQFKLSAGHKLQTLVILDDNSIQIEKDWYLQSEFGGWTHTWIPNHKEVFVFIAADEVKSAEDVRRIHDAFVKEIKYLSKKHGYGEFSDEQFERQCEQLAEKQRIDYVELMTRY